MDLPIYELETVMYGDEPASWGTFKNVQTGEVKRLLDIQNPRKLSFAKGYHSVILDVFAKLPDGTEKVSKVRFVGPENLVETFRKATGERKADKTVYKGIARLATDLASYDDLYIRTSLEQ